VGIWSYNVGYLTPHIQSSHNDNLAAQAVCDYSHTLQNVKDAGAWEQACGRALESTNTIYLCDKTGAHCWIQDN
jgi:hypothetical protein